jgi:putative endonuclease
MAESHDFGRHCEDLAARHLRRIGFCILSRNYRAGHREIDLIARKGTLVAFVEVKGRQRRDFGHPLEAITARKRREIESVARQWLARHGRPGWSYRFDAIAVQATGDGTLLLEHAEDAWRL